MDDYYGNSCNDDDKQAIAEFVRNYGNELLDILKANNLNLNVDSYQMDSVV